MIYVRKYGKPPYSVAVVHGGPGAPGSMAPVARELSRHCGVIEHLESATTIDGQVAELHESLKEHGNLPATLVGHSWGAWLSLIFAARHPDMAKKLVLVGSGPFEEAYAPQITETRMSRMTDEEKLQFRVLIDAIESPKRNKAALFSLYGSLLTKTDGYDLLPADDESYGMLFQENVYQNAWSEALHLRRAGGLVALAKQVRCPVVAIHGVHDPHPAEGVEKPLRDAVDDFRFVPLDKCGHEPWKERVAKDRFYDILIKELH
jgi:pimeloyl-ACP methyl ester carboxylesterase